MKTRHDGPTKKVTIELPTALAKRLAIRAVQDACSQRDIVIDAIEIRLKKGDRKGTPYS